LEFRRVLFRSYRNVLRGGVWDDAEGERCQQPETRQTRIIHGPHLTGRCDDAPKPRLRPRPSGKPPRVRAPVGSTSMNRVSRANDQRLGRAHGRVTSLHRGDVARAWRTRHTPRRTVCFPDFHTYSPRSCGRAARSATATTNAPPVPRTLGATGFREGT